jgi:hypothetical protein
MGGSAQICSSKPAGYLGQKRLRRLRIEDQVQVQFCQRSYSPRSGRLFHGPGGCRHQKSQSVPNAPLSEAETVTCRSWIRPLRPKTESAELGRPQTDGQFIDRKCVTPDCGPSLSFEDWRQTVPPPIQYRSKEICRTENFASGSSGQIRRRVGQVLRIYLQCKRSHHWFSQPLPHAGKRACARQPRRSGSSSGLLMEGKDYANAQAWREWIVRIGDVLRRDDVRRHR